MALLSWAVAAKPEDTGCCGILCGLMAVRVSDMQ